ncbi:MAG: hypothetical protein HC888_04290 [Candidatus Competibacteraceae bacterium]|nr:hypothetical protein [Candidatus Competibacteraceae bacterium]
MSTALRKQEPVLPDPHETETAEIVRLETATETMMAYIGYLNTEIMKEEDKPKPNMLKIQALQDQMDAVSKERKLITPSNKKLIAKAIYVYAPIMKAIDA